MFSRIFSCLILEQKFISAIIFCVSLIGKDILTVVENCQSVRRSKWRLFLTHDPNQISLPHQLHELQRSTKVALVPKGQGVKAVYLEANGSGESHEGSVLVEADRINHLFGNFPCVIHLTNYYHQSPVRKTLFLEI